MLKKTKRFVCTLLIFCLCFGSYSLFVDASETKTLENIGPGDRITVDGLTYIYVNSPEEIDYASVKDDEVYVFPTPEKKLYEAEQPLEIQPYANTWDVSIFGPYNFEGRIIQAGKLDTAYYFCGARDYGIKIYNYSNSDLKVIARYNIISKIKTTTAPSNLSLYFSIRDIRLDWYLTFDSTSSEEIYFAGNVKGL